MGSRYLLIEFDDDAASDTLRAQIDKATRSGKKFRVVGLFAKPRNLCECSKYQLQDYRAAERVVRGARFGWWLCRRCKKARMGDHQLENLMTPADIIDAPELHGVDPYMPDPRPSSYFFHIKTLSLMLLPFRVRS